MMKWRCSSHVCVSLALYHLNEHEKVYVYHQNTNHELLNFVCLEDANDTIEQLKRTNSILATVLEASQTVSVEDVCLIQI